MDTPILAEARPLTTRCQAEYDQVLRRFDRYLAALHEPKPPLAESVRAFLLALPGSARGNPRWALQRRYPELHWPTMPSRAWSGQGTRRRVRVEPPVEPRPWRRLLTPHTVAQYRQMLARFVRFQGQHPELDLADAVRAWIAGLSVPMGRLSVQALRWHYGPAVPWDEIPKPKPRRNEPVLRRTLMSPEEREQFRASLTSPRDAALTELFFVLRRFEAAGLYWQDIDFQEGVVSFVGKGARPRLALLPERTLVACAAWYLAAGRPSGDTPVFPGPDGAPLSTGRVSNLVRTLLRGAGVYKRWRGAHAWRRSWATAFLRANPGELFALREALGHASIATTQDYLYFDTDLDMRPRVSRVRL